MFEAYCKLLSTALQFGVPLKEVVKGFRNYSFEPSGFCRVGDDTEADTCTEIRSCASVVDLIAKILAWLSRKATATACGTSSPSPASAFRARLRIRR